MQDIQIGGLVPFTTIDYPGKLAAVLFLVGCPIRCAYCSNPHLIPLGSGDYDPKKIFDWIQSRKNKLEAIVFSGGEALMQGQATIEYMKDVKDLGFLIGLHTNGFYPQLLRSALSVIDWVGLDFKAASASKYKALCGNDVVYSNMLDSLDILVQNKKDCEIRLTCDPNYVSIPDIYDIADTLVAHGARKIAIQKYIPHFENDNKKTKNSEIEKFFTDTKLRSKLESMFDSVAWRN